MLIDIYRPNWSASHKSSSFQLASGSLKSQQHSLLEQPTSFEKIVALLRLPYATSCLAIAAADSILVFLVLALLSPTYIVQPWQLALASFFGGASLFLVFYMIRYIRLRIVATKEDLVQLYSEETFRGAFRRVNQSRSPFLLGIVLLVGFTMLYARALFPDILSNNAFVVSSAIAIAIIALGIPVIIFYVLGIGTFVWIYAWSLKGLDNLGKANAPLKRFTEDRMLGARPLGSLSLSLASAYFIPLTFFGVGAMFSPLVVLDIASLVVFLIIGVIMFFFPLVNVHRRMLDTKREEEKWIRDQLIGASQNPVGGDPLTRIAEVQRLQVLQQEVASISTWPFDTQMIGRFVTLISSAIASIVSAVIVEVFS